jgi:hypothetical protein
VKACLTITDLTRMSGDKVCVAGYKDDGICIRPQFKHGSITEDWLWDHDEVVIRPFARVELDLIASTPEFPHTEDWLVDPLHVVPMGAVAIEDRIDFLNRILDPGVEAIFGAQMEYRASNSTRKSCWIRNGDGFCSLGTVRCRAIRQVLHYLGDNGKLEYRLAFVDDSGTGYELPVTDLAFRYLLDRLREGGSPQTVASLAASKLNGREIFLRIGLARHWEKFPDQCFVQVTGIHTFPDYLDGRCFADL